MGPVLLLVLLVWTSEGVGVEIGIVDVVLGVVGLRDCGEVVEDADVVEGVVVEDDVADGMSDLVMVTALTLMEFEAATVGVTR
jgi:hypothetical protein